MFVQMPKHIIEMSEQFASIMIPLNSKINMFGMFGRFDHKVLALERPVDLQIHQWTTARFVPLCGL